MVDRLIQRIIALDHPLLMRELDLLQTAENGRRLYLFSAIITGAEALLITFLLPIPILPWLWRLPGLTAASTTIAREIEDQTWDTLRATPLTLHEIIYAKLGSVLRMMESYLNLVVIIRAAPLIIFVGPWFGALPITLERGILNWLFFTVAILIASAYYLFSPYLDVLTDAVIGMWASARFPNRASALRIAMIVRITMLALPLLAIIPLQLNLYEFNLTAGQVNDLSLTLAYGPSYTFLLELLDPGPSILVIVGFTLARLLFIRVMIALIVRRVATMEN